MVLKKYLISMSLIKFVFYFITIIFFNIINISFLTPLIKVILDILILVYFCFSTVFIALNKNKIIINNVSVEYEKIEDIRLYLKKTFFNLEKIFLSIKCQNKFIEIPIYKFSKKQINILLERLHKEVLVDDLERTKNAINNLKNYKIYKSSLTFGIVAVIIMCFVFHDYVFHPYRYFDNQIWLNEDYSKLQSFNTISFPKPNEINNYESYNFYVCNFEDSIMRTTFEKYHDTNNACLELKYSVNKYKSAEKEMLENNSFLQEPIKLPYFPNQIKDMWNMPVTSLTIGSFKINILNDNKKVFLNEISFIAFDGNNRIRYCYQNKSEIYMLKNETELKEYITKGFLMDW